MRDKIIARNLEIEDRMFVTIPREGFGTYKDKNDDFCQNLPMRVMNPCEREIGRIYKQLIEKIISEVRKKTGLRAVSSGSTKLKIKQDYSFIQFDVVDFYGSIGSISKYLIEETLN